MAYDGVQDHVEECGVQGVSLGNSVVSLEGRGILTSGPGHHGEPSSVRPENPERPGAYPVRCDNFGAPVPIQGTVRLLKVHKYLVEDRLHHGRKLL